MVLVVAGVGVALLVRDDDGEVGPGPSVGAVSSLDEVQTATVQIIAQGSFVDPEVGLVLDAAGAGSGFIIDPSGIAVTNNHVVTGAATIEVLVGGADEPLNAVILATSECSDLAVIDLEGDGYPYLEFYESDISTGLEVYAAGYPLGDPEFTLTRGIVSKARASGETTWASVDDIIEHDANINPGNSGGPLVNEAGQVVGVNYAGDDTTSQFFAIAPPTVQDVVASLRDEQPVDYLGINGQAVIDEEAGLSGVWVAAVESGSPAAELGLQGGDIVTTMEGLSLGTDGSMADYCDILRTQGTDAELTAEVLRFATSEYLTGTFNSGEELEVAASFADELEDPQAGSGGAATYSGNTSVTDDSGVLSLNVPVEWAEVDGSAITLDDATTTPSVTAATSLAGFNQNFSTSGVVMAVLPGVDANDPNGTLDALLEGIGALEACPESLGRNDYDDGLYFGSWEQLNGCDGTGASFVGIVASPEGKEFTVFVGVQLVIEADYEALDQIISSFVVTP